MNGPQDNPGASMITNKEDGLNETEEKKTVFEAVKERPKDKRKRDKNDDPTDIEGKYLYNTSIDLI